MENDGGNLAKPVWFAFKKSNKIVLTIGLCAVIAAGLFITRRSTQPPIPSISPAPTPVESTVHLRAVGDVMLGRSVAIQATKRHDWTWPFTGTIPRLPSADITVGNLEAPLIEHCPLTDEGMIFCAPKNASVGLVQAQFNIMSLANNHSQNYGSDGYQETKRNLSQVAIQGLGNYETTTQTLNGVTVGYIALDDVSSPLELAKVKPLLADLASRTHLIIALIHWGIEYQSSPSVRQKTLAADLVQNGVSIILGTHPHVIQPIETSGNALIMYSLGNFIFDQMWSTETRKGLIVDLDLTFMDHQLTKMTYQPIHTTIYDYGQPRIDDSQN